MYRNRRRYATYLTVLALTLTGLTVLVLPDAPLLGGKVSAQTPTSCPTPSPDPMRNPTNYTLFRNDNLFIAGQVAYGQVCQGDVSSSSYSNQKFTAKPGSTLDGNGFDAANINNQSPTGHLVDYRIAGGSGRILNQDSEQGVIYKLLNYSDAGQATYYVNVFDSSGTRWEHQFPEIGAGKVSHLDVAVGDLDRLRDKNGEYQDEVVLVSESGHATTQVTVISFKDFEQGGVPKITTFDTGIAVGYYIDRSIGSDYNRGGQVSVAAGDFDADGRMEFAASTVSSHGDVWLSIFRYNNDGKNNPQLTMTDHKDLYDFKPYDNTRTYQYTDIAAGDFNGSGRDQVMVSVVAQDDNHTIWVTGYDFNSDLTIHSQFAGSQPLGRANNNINGECNGNTNCGDTINQAGWVQLKAGLFKFDPSNGYGLRRRQLGILFGNARPAVGILEVANSTDIQWLPGAGAQNLDDISDSTYAIWRPGPTLGGMVPDVREAYTLIAGNFGAKDSNNPAWQLAAVAPVKTTTDAHTNNCTDPVLAFSEFELRHSIAAWQYTHRADSTSPYSYSLQNLRVPAGIAGSWNWRTQGGRNIAAVALDMDGKSLKLGAPVHFTLDNLMKTEYLLVRHLRFDG